METEPNYNLPNFNEGDWDCPKCGNQAFLICDDWSKPGTVQYFYECKSADALNPDCDYESERFPEKFYDEVIAPMQRPYYKGIIEGEMKAF
jgi:hypothetical protein